MLSRLAMLLFLPFALFGCQENRGTVIGSIVGFLPEQAQAIVESSCDWREDLGVLERLAIAIAKQKGFTEAAQVYDQLAREVCAAVKKAQARRSGRSYTLKVRNVRLKGSFVR